LRERGFGFVDGKPLQLALRELQATFTSPRALAAMAAIAAVLGLSGPFGTFAAMETVRRLVYWLAVVVLTYGVGRTVASFVAARIGDRLGDRRLRLLVASLACGVAVTLVVLVINEIAFGDTGLPPLLLWLDCTLISIAVLGVVAMVEPPAPRAVESASSSAALPEPGGPGEPPAIIARLPLPQRGRLLALSVKDHYVEVITDRGRALVLTRLSDAIREAVPTVGLQIHRSHWVAIEAVERVGRSGGRLFVEIRGGERLPISRGFLPAARAAGLLA
jgi:LytTr DNA-binding domain